MKQDFQHQLFDKVKTVEGNSGTITHCGFDAGGQMYIVQWVKSDGDVKTRWYRNSEILT